MEILNHPGLIALASGKDPFLDTARAYREAYAALGIDIVTRVPDGNAPTPTPPGEVMDLGDGYKRVHLGVYDSVCKTRYAFDSVEEFWAAREMDLDSAVIRTPTPHPLTREDIERRILLLGETGLYNATLYTTLFMWAVEYLGWEVFMIAAAMDPTGFKEKFLDLAFDRSLTIVRMLSTIDGPFLFCHDDLADARGPVFDPKWYDTYILPRYTQLWAPAKAAGKKIIFLADGNMNAFLRPLKETGVDGVLFESPATDFDLMIESFGDAYIIGGIEKTKVILGHPQEIRRHVRAVAEKTRGLPGYAMSMAGGLHGGIPMENLEAYFDERVETGYTPEQWRHRDRDGAAWSGAAPNGDRTA